jgi:hypothetical protein
LNYFSSCLISKLKNLESGGLLSSYKDEAIQRINIYDDSYVPPTPANYKTNYMVVAGDPANYGVDTGTYLARAIGILSKRKIVNALKINAENDVCH